MNLGDILGPENILPDLKAANRWEAIDELIGNLVGTGKIHEKHAEAFCRFDGNALIVCKKREYFSYSTV